MIKDIAHYFESPNHEGQWCLIGVCGFIIADKIASSEDARQLALAWNARQRKRERELTRKGQI